MDAFGEQFPEFQKCIIFNKTVQHLLPDFIKRIKEEIAHLAKQQRELASTSSLSSLPEYHVRRPFLKSRSGECPPANADSIARYQRKECNLGAIRAVILKRYLKDELISLISNVARCSLEKRIEKLENRRESLLSQLSSVRVREQNMHLSATKEHEFTGRLTCAELLSSLKEIESVLGDLHNMPVAPSKWLTTALASSVIDLKRITQRDCKSKQKSAWEKRIFKRYHGPKFVRQYTVQTWLDILSHAEEYLTGAEWAEISNHVFHGSISDVNLRLVWHHRVSPGYNRAEWISEEDEQLIGFVNHFGERGRWEEVAKALNTGRTAFCCFQRWQTVHNPAFKPNRDWTTAEDTALLDILKRLLEVYPPSLIDWEVVAAYHTTRTARECELRALAICPLFNTSRRADLVTHWTNANKQTGAPTILRPFSPSEDLQLLMSVQRYGNAGGRAGSGGGIGVGSWAVIATALPGRSVKSCQQRYLNLCEQFQPWTYSEDRKLYRLRLEGEKFGDFIDWKPFYQLRTYRRLLPYFPGRSLKALKQRFILLLRWSRIWTRLRRMVSSSLSSEITTARSDSLTTTNKPAQSGASLIYMNTSQSNSDIQPYTNGGTLAELRGLLLRSPFVAQLVSQLRNSGVSDPEAEAFRLLTTWNGEGCTDEHSRLASNEDPEFVQLLEDLASGLLVPRPLLTMPINSRTSHPSSLVPQSSAEVHIGESEAAAVQLSLVDAKRVVALTQLKQLLAGPVRRFLFSLITRSDQSLMCSYRDLLQEGATESQMQTAIEMLWSEPGWLSSANARVTMAAKLLYDEQQFWLAFGDAINYACTTELLNGVDKVAYLRVVAPFIARLMTRSESQQRSRRKQRSSQKRLHDHIEPHLRTNVSSDLSITAAVDVSLGDSNELSSLNLDTMNIAATNASPEKCSSTPTCQKLTIWRRTKLLQIRRLVLMYGRFWRPSSNAYAIASVRWTGGPTALSVADQSLRPKRYAPPVLRRWPPEFAAQTLRNPTRVCRHFFNGARACIRHGLKLNDIKLDDLSSQAVTVTGTTSSAFTVPSVASQSPTRANVLPPSFATFLAFKSLLPHLSVLVRKSGIHLAQFVEARERLIPSANSNQQTDNGTQTDLSKHNFSSNHLNILTSPGYLRFVSVGLSLLLWPALLSGISAQTFVDAGKRCWHEAFTEIPPSVLNNATVEVPLKVPRMDSEPSDSDSEDFASSDPMCQLQTSPPSPDVFMSAPQRKKSFRKPSKKYRWTGSRLRMVRYRHMQLLRSSSIRFKISASSAEPFALILPSDVKSLYGAGFRPQSMLRARK